MQMINLNREDAFPLVDQIVDGIRQRIDERELRPGSRLPSIRAFADSHSVSRFTVVEAYERLVAQGYLSSRRGAGFFTAARPESTRTAPSVTQGNRRNEEMVWLIRRLLEARDGTLLAGGPWLPDDWLDDGQIRRALRALAGRPGDHTVRYGDPRGYFPLRQYVAEVLLPDTGIDVDPSRILLTTGASQALDLIVRRLLDPGDTVLVDDPGYYNLFGNLRAHGVRLVGVPRLCTGPDLDALERLAAEHRPKLYFTQSALQNPTGTSLSPHASHRALQAASRYGFRIVEDDIFADLDPRREARLAALDQLDRVIYVRSFSKTLSGSLRVGFLACNPEIFNELLDTKMVTGIASSMFSEKLIHQLLSDGHYRKYIARIRERLTAARGRTAEAFEELGLEIFYPPEAGMFMWARYHDIEDSLALAQRALKQDLLLAPGTVFRPGLQPSPWMRFNVAVCAEDHVRDRLARLADSDRAVKNTA